MQEEAEQRVASIGSDRTRWPAMARDEVLRLEKKQLVNAATASLFFAITLVTGSQEACCSVAPMSFASISKIRRALVCLLPCELCDITANSSAYQADAVAWWMYCW